MRSKEREYKPIKFWDEGSSTIPLKKTAASSKAIKNLQSHNSNGLKTKAEPRMIALIPDTGSSLRTRSRPKNIDSLTPDKQHYYKSSTSKTRKQPASVQDAKRLPFNSKDRYMPGRGSRDHIRTFDLDQY